MSNTVSSPTTNKSAYKRPYKSRGQRREIDRRKYDKAKEHRFLRRGALIVGLLVIIVLGFVVKGMNDQESTQPPSSSIAPEVQP